MEYTPTPWFVAEESSTTVLARDSWHSIATCSGWSDSHLDWLAERAEQKANAAFIVRACNSHTALREAAKGAQITIHNLYCKQAGTGNCTKLCRQLQAALAAAEEE